MTTHRGFARFAARAARTRLHVVAALAVTAGCGMSGDDELDYGVAESAATVGSFQTSTCSTSVVIGLSKQIAQEVGCMSPGALVQFSSTANLQFTSTAVLPFLHSTARTDLLAVASNRVVQVNSAFRTVVQQYLLFRWFQLGRCGITAAATPGNSNHESGRALDVQNFSALITPMANRGWAHDVPGDPVHFDHLSSPDIRGKDVLAFQRLWNRNNTGDRIAEDGLYGPQTEARVKASPATGFTRGATCLAGLAAEPAELVQVEGPDKVAPGGKAHFVLTVANRGGVDWPASTKLMVAGEAESQMYDRDTWVSPREIGTIGSDIGFGATGIVELDIAAPMVTEETPLFTQITLDAGDGSAALGTIPLAITVTPNGDEDTSADAGDEHDDGAAVTGGCAAGGSAGWAALMLPALIALRRRRR